LRITLIKFVVNDGGGSGTGCCGIDIRADTARIYRERKRVSK